MIGGDEKWEAEAENGRRRQKMGDGGRKWAVETENGQWMLMKASRGSKTATSSASFVECGCPRKSL